jgi:hypothetical protein
MGEIIAALYGAIQVVDNLVQFGQIVAGLTPGDDPQALATIEATLQELGNKIQQYSTQILSALSQIDQHIFGANMAERLAEADQAGVALALWQKDREDSARQQALDTSEGGLAKVVELYANSVFPGPAMVLVLARVFLARLAVLGVFPTARTGVDTEQLRTALGNLITSTDAIAAQIQAANQVHVTTQHGTIPGKPPINFYIVAVRYVNIIGDKVYNQTVTRPTFWEAQVAAQPLLAAANAVEVEGLADDLDHAQVTRLRKIIETTKPIVG